MSERRLSVLAAAANLPTLFHDPTGLIKFKFGSGLHDALDAIGLIPGVGDVVDLVHAGIYLAEGTYLQAGLSAVSAIPGVGDVVGKGGKLLVRGAEELAQRAGARAFREVTAEGAERAAREVAEEGITKVGGRNPINAQWAGKTHPSDVKFTKQGFPDFSPWAKAKAQIKNLTGKYDVDAAMANKAVGLKSTPENMVWHHVEDGRTMLLVQRDIHQAARHTGGAAVIRAGGG